jgi:hypothetical protein
MGAIAELIFFPALLAGPLGRVFKPRKKQEQTTVGEPTAPTGPPQLQVVHDDDADDDQTDEAEVTNDDSASNQNGDSGAPAPHTSRARTPRSLRRDLPHRRRG